MVNLRKTTQQDDSFPRLIFVHMGSADRAEEFFANLWPEALAIGDPKQDLYKAFEVTIGSIGQFFKPAVWKAYWTNRKFGIGAPVGNTMRNPGAVLIHEKHILHQQSADHFGEQVDVAAIKALLPS